MLPLSIVGSVECKNVCREKISTTARFSPLAFRDNLAKNELKYKTVAGSTDSSRMSYFFYIIALTVVLAVAVQGNQSGISFETNVGMLITRLEKTASSSTLSKALASPESLTSVPGGKMRLCNPPLTVFLVFLESGSEYTRNLYYHIPHFKLVA
jgi:hypothetical protein